MKYYSETVKKFFDTEKECLEAEQEYKKKTEAEEREKLLRSNERRKKAKEVEEAYKRAVAAQKDYSDLLKAFCKEYGAFHMTFSDTEMADIFKLFKIF